MGECGGFGSASFGGLGRAAGESTGVASISDNSTTGGGATVSGGGAMVEALVGVPKAASARAR